VFLGREQGKVAAMRIDAKLVEMRLKETIAAKVSMGSKDKFGKLGVELIVGL